MTDLHSSHFQILAVATKAKMRQMEEHNQNICFENSNLSSQESEEPEIEQLTFNSQSSSGQPIAYLCNCLALTLKGCQEWDTI